MVWLEDVFCGLAAYILSRWIWQKDTGGVFNNLVEELGTFAVLYILLKLSLRGLGLIRRNRKASLQK